MKKHTILHISIDGLCEGHTESQLIPYVQHFKNTYNMIVLSHEKKQDLKNKQRIAEINDNLKPAKWYKLTHNGGDGFGQYIEMSYGQAKLLAALTYILATNKIDIIHLRSSQPGFLIKFVQKLGIKIINDTRGDWIQERIEAKIWPENGILHKIYKPLETSLIKKSDHMVVLTEHAKTKWTPLNKNITVIPCCTQKPQNITDNKSDQYYQTIYIGAISTWYDINTVIKCMSSIKLDKPVKHVLVLKNYKDNKNTVDSLIKEHNLQEITIHEKLTRQQTIELVSQSHIGFCCLKPIESKKSSSPIKISEYLSCGVIPIVKTNDSDDNKLYLNSVGIPVYVMGNSLIQSMLNDKDTPQRIKTYFTRNYSFESAATSYAEIYKKLLLAF